MSDGVDRGSAFGRWLAQDRTAVDALLVGALARGGDRDAVRAAVVEVAGAFAGADVLDPDLGRAVVARATDLAARGRWAAGGPDRAAVLELLPRLTGLTASQPEITVEAVVAAARSVARGGDLALFGSLLAAVPPVGDAGTVRAAVLVAAWRAGAARYRAAALREAAGLPVDVATAVLGLAPGTDPVATLARHAQDPFWWPGYRTEPGVLRRIGGFRGFGGPWLARPRVVPGGPTGCAVTADGSSWAVVADAHGAAVVRLGDEDTAPPSTRTTAALPVPWSDTLTGIAPAAPDGAVVVVSRRHSYCVDAVRLAS